jgi:hypothetical protein
VSSTLAWVVLALCLVVAVYAGYLIMRNRPVDDPLFYGSVVLEVALVVQLVGGCVALATTARDVEAVTFVGYLLTAVIAPPVGVLWGISEKSRWGTGVVIVAMVTVAALQVRIAAIWAGAGA